MKTLTVERLQELLAYDPSTGIFTWRSKSGGNGKIPAGNEAGSICASHRYRQIRIDKCLHQAHRLAWFYVHGTWPVLHIDHVNGTPSDNRIANLREASPTKNGQNQRRAHSRSTSGLLGAAWDEGRQLWKASIRFNGRGKYLGHYLTPKLAHQAYLEAKRKLHEGCTI